MNLVIVESPHKAATIQKFLGDDFKVVSSKGHIRDLHEKELSVDTKNNFAPKYVISADKKNIVKELETLADKAQIVYLASDEDREGEAISWHLAQTLKLDPLKTKRITFHEITKSAIQNALLNPRQIDMNLVDAQQARRVLDRLVGYEVSPILWKKIRKGLSAGRVQSVALRLVVDREREILASENSAYYKVEADFTTAKHKAKATLNKKFRTLSEAKEFLEDSIEATYTVSDIEKKEGSRNPAAPFTTSTLQQEAGRKLKMSVTRTMSVAQILYEKGLITYMRTDSTNLSNLALNTAKKYIEENFGAQYSKTRQYKTKSKGAQEAHEAIRPTYIENVSISGSAEEQKLYNLIWKRTVASQMAEAKLLNTNVLIDIDKRSEQYALQASEVIFDGFLKLYMEGTDDESADESLSILPPLHIGEQLNVTSVKAICKFTNPPYRYTEPTLVKKMEELGIGRPSTYAPTISTLTKERGYLIKGDKSGEAKEVINLELKGDIIKESSKTEVIGAEKGKLLPTDIGMSVSDFLVGNFSDVVDYGFTAGVETNFDKIAEGELNWQNYLCAFYPGFHKEVENALSGTSYQKVEREIGVDPSDGKVIKAKLGQYGPYVQKGEDSEKLFASLEKGQLIESITLEEALKLFSLPRTVGELDGQAVVVKKGKFGPYVEHDGKRTSLPKGADPLSISLEQCLNLLAQAAAAKKALYQWGDISVLNGAYGPYIKANGQNYKIPKGVDINSLTEEKCKEIISTPKSTKPKKTTKPK